MCVHSQTSRVPVADFGGKKTRTAVAKKMRGGGGYTSVNFSGQKFTFFLPEHVGQPSTASLSLFDRFEATCPGTLISHLYLARVKCALTD